MRDRLLRSLRRALLPSALILAAVALGTLPADAGRHRGGHFHGGGGFHHGPFFHGHPFVFFGAGVYAGYYGYPYYPYPYPAYYPPPAAPAYISPTDCYNTVPRAPGVADLYTCSGQYVGPVAVP